MNIEYLIINISLPNWNNGLVHEVFRFDAFYHSSDEPYFKKYFLNHEFADCAGKTFKVTGKTPIKNVWVLLFTSKKSKMQLEYTGKELSLKELRNLMVKRVEDIDDWGTEPKRIWINSFNKATTYRELIHG